MFENLKYVIIRNKN